MSNGQPSIQLYQVSWGYCSDNVMCNVPNQTLNPAIFQNVPDARQVQTTLVNPSSPENYTETGGIQLDSFYSTDPISSGSSSYVDSRYKCTFYRLSARAANSDLCRREPNAELANVSYSFGYHGADHTEQRTTNDSTQHARHYCRNAVQPIGIRTVDNRNCAESDSDSDILFRARCGRRIQIHCQWPNAPKQPSQKLLPI